MQQNQQLHLSVIWKRATGLQSLLFLIFLVTLNLTVLHAQQFIKMSVGSPATDVAASRSVNWIDYNSDGYLDLFVSRGKAGGQNNILYRNDGPPDFNLISMDTLIVSHDGKPSDGSSWGDIDNDGNLDLFVVNWYGINNMFYKNTGSGNFQQVTAGSFVNDGGYSETCSWGDYNNDGLLDLYVANSGGDLKEFLYKNLGNGQFQKITSGPLVNNAGTTRGVTWVDYDNDGDLDLFAVNENGENEFLYKNLLVETGVDSFAQITSGPLVNSGGSSWSASWGDYDNDGDLDVFITNWGNQTNFLFNNNGDGTFTRVYYAPLTSDAGSFATASWVDYDNDGDLDIFVTTAYTGFPSVVPSKCYLYKNMLAETGTISFARITSEALVNETGSWYGTSWGDYNEDGFMDVFVAGTMNENSTSMLYLNTGNTNHWLTIDCIGKFSNRSAIGARIKVKSVISGNPTWQMREIDGQSGYCGQTLQQHFGIGDATIVDSLKIEWPSGQRDIFTNVACNRHLTIVENDSTPPVLSHPQKGETSVNPGDTFRWDKTLSGAPYWIQVSTELTFSTGIVVDDSTVTDTMMSIPELLKGQYFWRVKSTRFIYSSSWSDTGDFVSGGALINYSAAKRWNLISIPFIPNDAGRSTLYPSSQSAAYKYSGNLYHATDTLIHGTGYWLRLPEDSNFQVVAFPIMNDTIDVTAGWNLIGSVSEPISALSVESDPPGILQSDFWSYATRYFVADSIFPSKGYWVKTSQSGKLILSAHAAASSAAGRHVLHSLELPPSPPFEESAPMEKKPESFALDQNYPNPFNPVTSLKYQLPVASKVTLRVFNSIGQEMATLIDAVQEAGYKSVDWDASLLASGIYFCRIEIAGIAEPARSFVQVRKMVLMK
jgi:enediyne biosynthesis protein E4